MRLRVQRCKPSIPPRVVPGVQRVLLGRGSSREVWKLEVDFFQNRLRLRPLTGLGRTSCGAAVMREWKHSGLIIVGETGEGLSQLLAYRLAAIFRLSFSLKLQFVFV